MVKWDDAHEKGKAAEILVMEAMSSKESCYEDDDHSKKVVKYDEKQFPWESTVSPAKKKLDKAYKILSILVNMNDGCRKILSFLSPE